MERGKVHDSQNIEDDPVHLRRKITLVSAIALIIGTIVGSGIFIAPKGVLMYTGSVGLSLVVWALSGLLALIGAMCYAELGTTFSKSGCDYTYLMETLGPFPAFLQLWNLVLFNTPASASFLSLAFARYVLEPFYTPCEPPESLIKIISIFGVTFIVAINCRSVNIASGTQVLLTLVKVAALVMIIVPGFIYLFRGQTQNFQNMFDTNLMRLEMLPLAFYSGAYAYSGWFFLNLVREEIIDPSRNMPLAIFLSVILVTILYLLVNVAYYTMMTPQELLLSTSVAGTFAARSSKGLTYAVPVLVAISCLGALNGLIFGIARMLFVGGREGHWPVIFSMIHIHRRTPLPAVIILYPMSVAMIFLGEIYQLINFISFSTGFFTLFTILGLLIHRHRFPHFHRPFKVPFLIVFAYLLVSIFIVGLSLYSAPVETGYSLGLAMTGTPVYFLTIDRFRLPQRWKHSFNHYSKKLQILLQVTPQEIKTY